jgi:type IV pilus assembly protein PilM
MDQSAVVEAIGRLKAALGLKTKQVATAISGHSVIVKKIALPPMSKEDLAAQIPAEAEHHIPFRRDEVDIDHQVVTPKNAQGQMEVILVAAKKEMIADYTQVIRDAKLQPVVMDVAAFAVQNAFEAGYGPGGFAGPAALIHVGNALTHINVVVSGTSLFTRDVTVGGAAFTEELQRRLHVSTEEAENLKLQVADPAAGGSRAAQARAVLDEVAESTAAKLQRSLDFFLASAHDVTLTKVYLSGGAAKLPVLARMLEQRTHLPVEVLDPFRQTSIDSGKLDADFVRAHGIEAAVAVGLAMRRPGDAAA